VSPAAISDRQFGPPRLGRSAGAHAADLGARQPLRPLRDRYGDEVAAQLILVAAGDTNVGITPIDAVGMLQKKYL
jgi:hypothetical protein